MSDRYNPVEQSRFHDMLHSQLARDLANLAVAGLALVSFGRLAGEELHEVSEQHGGESVPAQVVDLVTKDFNPWKANKRIYVSDDDGYGSEQAVNDAALALLATGLIAAEESVRKPKHSRRYR